MKRHITDISNLFARTFTGIPDENVPLRRKRTSACMDACVFTFLTVWTEYATALPVWACACTLPVLLFLFCRGYGCAAKTDHIKYAMKNYHPMEEN